MNQHQAKVNEIKELGDLPLAWPETADEARWWLAGFVDAHGCIYSHIGRGDKAIIISDAERGVVDMAQYCCKMLGIPVRRSVQLPRALPSAAGGGSGGASGADGQVRQGRPRYYLHVTRLAAIRRFADVVPLQNATLRAKLKAILAFYERRAAERASWSVPAGA